MFYAIIHRPEIDTTKIKEVSRKYDPYFGLVGPHVTLVFPFKNEDIEQAELETHADKVAKLTEPFQVRLNELELAWDQWLFLTPSIGKSEFEKLHDDLYKGILEKFLRTDIEYIPHIGLGHFAMIDSEYSLKNPTAVSLDEEKYENARTEIEKSKLDFTYTVTSIELISVNDEFTKSEMLATFDFKNS